MSRANPEIAPTNNLVDDLSACQQEQERVLLQLQAYERQHAEDQNRIDALLDNTQQKPNAIQQSSATQEGKPMICVKEYSVLSECVEVGQSVMSDNELIELAAKAVGITGEWVRDTAFIQARYSFNVPYNNHGMMTSVEWNPLREDSDAMRLAINLGMNLMMLPANLEIGFCTVGVGFSNDSGNPRITISENYNQGPYKAVRRAIVRAAAEIGRSV